MAHGVIAAGFRRIATDKYICGGCQSRVIDCTAHCIREKVLDNIVLRYLRQIVSYARYKSDESYAMVMANCGTEVKKQFKENEKLRSEFETKIAQLDKVFRLDGEMNELGMTEFT